MELKESALALIFTTLIILFVGLITGGYVFFGAAALALLFIAFDYYRLGRVERDMLGTMETKCGLSKNEVYLGASTQLVCRLIYGGDLVRRVRVLQSLPPSFEASGAWKHIKLVPGSTVYLKMGLSPSAAGTFTIPSPRLEVESWLFRRSFPIGRELKVSVILPLGSLVQRVGGSTLRAKRTLDIFEPAMLKKGQGSDFLGIRNYEGGDSLRHIDWVRSSRHGRLMVREYEGDQPLPVFFLLDIGPSMGLGGPRSGLKSAVGLTSSLFNRIMGSSERIGVICFSPSRVVHHLPPQFGGDQSHRVRALLSSLQASKDEGTVRHDKDTLPGDLKRLFNGQEGLDVFIDEALREYTANISEDGLSRAVLTALRSVSTPCRLIIMTDLSMGLLSLVNNVRIARYYGHKASVVLIPHVWHDDAGLSAVESADMLRKLRAYGIDAVAMDPEDTPEDVLGRGGTAVVQRGKPHGG
jgi:uncharacterized protein (DUF58 family)